MFRLDGKAALVTGASGGIGAAIARALHEQGARVVLSGTRREALDALEDLVRYYRTNAHRMKYRLYHEDGLPVGSGAVESAHRHVLQTRMKRAGQRWALRNARRMARLRAAYRTAGAHRFYGAIRKAHQDTVTAAPRTRARRQHFRYSRYGSRDLDRCQAAASN